MKLEYDAQKIRMLSNTIKNITDTKSHYMQGDCNDSSAWGELGFLNKKEKDPFYSFKAQLHGDTFAAELKRTKSNTSDIISLFMLGLIVGGIAFCIVYFLANKPLKWAVIIGLSSGLISASGLALIFLHERNAIFKLADRFMLRNFNARRKK